MRAESRDKVLFISHEASRTGAPLFLLNFLKWFKHNIDIPFLILLKADGEMELEFRGLGPTLVLDRLGFRGQSLLAKEFGGLWLRLRRISKLRKLRTRLLSERIRLIYSNTITNGELLDKISLLNCPVITHVHELEQLIRSSGSRNVRLVQKYTQHYLAASEAVRSNLVHLHEIPIDRVDVIHSAIPITVATHTDARQNRSQLLKELAIPEESLIIGACGASCMHKGTDLFVELALAVLARYPRVPVNFIWVGPETPSLRFVTLQRQVQNYGLSGYVHFVGNQAKPLDYFAAFDVFAMTSREDSFPLVMLEAASLEKPIVCFGCAGGAKEFVEDDCGFVIPNLDVNLMAQKILALLGSGTLREKFGRRAAQKLRERHIMEVSAPKIVNVMERFLG